MWAATYGYLDYIKIAVGAGVDIHAQDEEVGDSGGDNL